MKIFFKKKWVKNAFNAVLILAFTLALTSESLFEDKVQNMNSGYGKKQLVVLLMNYIDQTIGKPFLYGLLILIAALFSFNAYKKYPD